MSLLKEGYYLSIYSDIDPILHVLGTSLRHDHNMTLFKMTGPHVEIVHHWEFERISGLKHHQTAFYEKEDAVNFINELLGEYLLSLDDMKEVIGMPELGDSEDYHSIKDVPDIAYHAISHLFTSMIMDSEIFHNENIIALAVDGGPDFTIDKKAYKKNGYCGAVSIKGKVEFFPIPSPGPYWYYLSLLYKIPEGTLMALAYATTARFKGELFDLQDIYKVVDISNSVKSLRGFSDYIFLYPKENIDEICSEYDERFTEQENKISMIMKFVQETTMQSMNHLVEHILNKYRLDPKETYIALAGGYALNCPTNTEIALKYGFKGQLSCPCVNDSGLAIGMGLYYFYKKCGYFDFCFRTAYYGDADHDLAGALKAFEPYIKSTQDGIGQAVDDIIHEPIVWFDGRSEVGPRALGHRSILGNPAKTESKDMLNLYKKREWWRPVAPIVLEEERDKWFIDSFPSSYMLNNFQIKSDKKEQVEAILHLDGSARIQTITEKDDPQIYAIVKGMYEKTGIPIICNTSLNDKGEPIVDKITEAFNFSLRKGIKIVYVNGVRVELYNHSRYKEEKPLERYHQYFTKYRGNESILSRLNPYKLDFVELNIYKINEVLQQFDITSENDVKSLKKIISKFRASYDLYGNILM